MNFLSYAAQGSHTVWLFVSTRLSLVQKHAYFCIFFINGKHQDRFFHEWDATIDGIRTRTVCRTLRPRPAETFTIWRVTRQVLQPSESDLVSVIKQSRFESNLLWYASHGIFLFVFNIFLIESCPFLQDCAGVILYTAENATQVALEAIQCLGMQLYLN